STPPDVIVTNEVIGITVTEGHPIVTVLDHVLLVESMLRTPAEVNAFGAALNVVVTHDGTLATRTRMKGEPHAVVQMTVLYEDIVGDAPDNPVAVEIAHRHATHGDAIAFVH